MADDMIGSPNGRDTRVAVLGAGMHPWGKWGRNFVEYGVAAARDALRDAGLRWEDVQFVSGADTIRNGYPGFIAGATFAQALGWTGARVSSCYAACASGASAIASARAQILAGLCDVALVVGADTTPKGFFAPVGGERKDDPDWLRFRLIGATNPTYFALYARRRMDRFGATDEDFAPVKVKNARHGLDEPVRPLSQGGHGRRGPRVADRRRPAAAARDLRDVRRRGGARLVQPRLRPAARRGGTARHGLRGLDGHAHGSRARSSRCRTSRPTRPRPAGSRTGPASDRRSPARRTRRPGSARRTSTSRRSTTSLPRSSSTGTRTSGCAAKGRPRSCCATARPRSAAGSRSTRAGGLSCFGEAIPAQAIAQVCECVWQLRGQADGRQVDGARVAVTANQGLFGHGSSVIVTR